MRAGTLRQLTSSAKSERAPRWSPDGRTLAFLSNREGPTQVYVMPLDGGEATAVTRSDKAIGDYRWSPTGKQIAFLAGASKAGAEDEPDAPQVMDREQSLDCLWVVDLVSKTPRQVTRGALRVDDFAWLDASRLVAAASEQPKVEEWTDALYAIGVADGKLTRIAGPAQPFEGAVTVAAKLPLVLLVNPRGSTGYGEAFAKADRADEGGGDYRDLMTALDTVLARGETDPARLGIAGWSYGGQMTEWAIGHTTRFKAAVAGAGVYADHNNPLDSPLACTAHSSTSASRRSSSCTRASRTCRAS